MRKSSTLFFLFVIFIFFIICVIIDFTDKDLKSHIKTSRPIDLEKKFRNTKPRTSLFFLKTHKCASTTVQNIIMRFGVKHGLYFALPALGNYLGNPPLFQVQMIDKKITPRNKKFDIFAHHTRYSYEPIKKVIKNNTAFVTIIRDPACITESLFAYYHGVFKNRNISLENLLNNPNATVMKRIYPNRFGLNQMLFDMGADETIFYSVKKVNKFIKKIDSEFDLVMVSEYMEASIVLFANLMRWPLEDVVFLKLNSRNSTNKRVLNETEQNTLRKLNYGDWLLYKAFLSKFHDKIREYGKEKLLSDVNKLITLNVNLYQDCVLFDNQRGYAKTVSYSLRNNDWLCVYATKSELSFTNELRFNQLNRLNVLNQLTNFIYSNKSTIFR